MHAKMMCNVSVVRIGTVFKQNVCIRIACKHVSKCFQIPTASPGISEMNQTYIVAVWEPIADFTAAHFTWTRL